MGVEAPDWKERIHNRRLLILHIVIDVD